METRISSGVHGPLAIGLVRAVNLLFKSSSLLSFVVVAAAVVIKRVHGQEWPCVCSKWIPQMYYIKLFDCFFRGSASSQNNGLNIHLALITLRVEVI